MIILDIHDYLNLFPGCTREKPRFSALAEAVLRQVADLIALVPGLMSGFSFASAAGAALDALGESVSVPRREGWDDETYRGILLRKLKLYTWNGMNETSFGYLEEGEILNDRCDGTVIVQTDEPLPAKEILPVPIGVKTCPNL